jgi:hypothetical protein
MVGYTMSKVVSLCTRRQSRNEELEIEAIFNASDVVLDVLADQFEEGIAIGILDGQLQISSTMDDIDSIMMTLEAAVKTVKEEY